MLTEMNVPCDLFEYTNIDERFTTRGRGTAKSTLGRGRQQYFRCMYNYILGVLADRSFFLMT